MDANRISHLQSEDNLKAVAFKQGPIIPSFEPFPVALQRIREADPFPAIDNKPDNIGTLKLRMASGEFVGLLTGRAAWNRSLVGFKLWLLLPVVTLACRT